MRTDGVVRVNLSVAPRLIISNGSQHHGGEMHRVHRGFYGEVGSATGCAQEVPVDLLHKCVIDLRTHLLCVRVLSNSDETMLGYPLLQFHSIRAGTNRSNGRSSSSLVPQVLQSETASTNHFDDYALDLLSIHNY
ncbi:unnamed protein product [Leptosia nina]|uniref:Uncharacterized protein n=1 Tax=Leptosia nina TaxID=320188 RepID=A0AAV1JY79_9NEOP